MRYFLLLIPVLVAIATPLYNHLDPRLAGFPFFFWFLLAMVPVTALLIYITYKLGVR